MEITIRVIENENTGNLLIEVDNTTVFLAEDVHPALHELLKKKMEEAK